MANLTYNQVLNDIYQETSKDILYEEKYGKDEEDDLDEGDNLVSHSDHKYNYAEIDNADEFNKEFGNRGDPLYVVQSAVSLDLSKNSANYGRGIRTIVLNIDSVHRKRTSQLPVEVLSPRITTTTVTRPPLNIANPAVCTVPVIPIVPSEISTAFVFNLSRLYRNITSVKLTSVEFSNTFYTFSKLRNNTSFTIKILDVLVLPETKKIDGVRYNYTANNPDFSTPVTVNPNTDNSISSTQSTAKFTGSISGTTLTISGNITGSISIYQFLSGSGIIPGTYLTSSITTSNTCTVSISQNVSSRTMYTQVTEASFVGTITKENNDYILTVDSGLTGTIAIGQYLLERNPTHGVSTTSGILITDGIGDRWTISNGTLGTYNLSSGDLYVSPIVDGDVYGIRTNGEIRNSSVILVKILDPPTDSITINISDGNYTKLVNSTTGTPLLPPDSNGFVYPDRSTLLGRIQYHMNVEFNNLLYGSTSTRMLYPTFVINYDQNTNAVFFQYSNGTDDTGDLGYSWYKDVPFTITFPEYGLGYYLGFTETSYTSVSTDFPPDSNSNFYEEIISDLAPNTEPDKYIYLKINDWNLIDHQSSYQTSFSAFAKIQLPSTKNTIIFDSNYTNSSTKEYVFEKPINIQRLDINFLDSLGKPLPLRDNYSFTIEIKQVNNIAVYQKLLED